MNVGEAVDPLAGEVGDGGHQVHILGVGAGGQIIGHADGVDGGTEDGIIHGVFNLLAEHVDTHVHLAQAFNIFFTSHQCHSIASFLLLNIF